MKFAQARFLGLAEIKEKMFAVIFSAELKREFGLRKNKLVELFQILVANATERGGELVRVLNFRSDQPKREHEWQIRDVFPCLTQIPEIKAGMRLSKSHRLITDEETRDRAAGDPQA